MNANSSTVLIRKVIVVGAGVIGLWQALVCARTGFKVRLVERRDTLLGESASTVSAGMLSPDSEADTVPDGVRKFGQEGIRLWGEFDDVLIKGGGLVVAAARDRAELTRFEKFIGAGDCFERVDPQGLSNLEPDLAGRFPGGLFFKNDAHVIAKDALRALYQAACDAGVDIHFGSTFGNEAIAGRASDTVVLDCRGIGAAAAPFDGTANILAQLRGVRGERILIKSKDVSLKRPVHLLHPRYSIYVVPWRGKEFVVGATQIESSESGAASVRSVLELLGGAFSLHPAFGEAQVLDIGVGVRPAFADNLPRAVVGEGGQVICVNGAYRYGYLLAPVLARAVSEYLCKGAVDHPLVQRAAAFGPGAEVL